MMISYRFEPAWNGKRATPVAKIGPLEKNMPNSDLGYLLWIRS
jgi:hypothetical protein